MALPKFRRSSIRPSRSLGMDIFACSVGTNKGKRGVQGRMSLSSSGAELLLADNESAFLSSVSIIVGAALHLG